MLQLKIDNEIPFNRWLYNYIFATLNKTYIVETQEENMRELGPDLVPTIRNEYAASKRDLMI